MAKDVAAREAIDIRWGRTGRVIESPRADGGLAMLRFLFPAVAIVAACMAVYATSLRAPSAEDQLTVLPVVFATPHPPAPAQPESVKPAPLRAENPHPVIEPPLAGGYRPYRRHSSAVPNPEPPSIHELLRSAKAALAGNKAPLIRRLREFETAFGNRLRNSVATQRDFASRTRYWDSRSAGGAIAQYPNIKQRKDIDDSGD